MRRKQKPKRLLEDPRVRTLVNVHAKATGKTPLHATCSRFEERDFPSIVHLLFDAGANPALTDKSGRTPLVYLRAYEDEEEEAGGRRYPEMSAAIALFEQYPAEKRDATKASLLVKARRFAQFYTPEKRPWWVQLRVVRGKALPRVELVVPGEEDGELVVPGEEDRELVAFVCGIGRDVPKELLKQIIQFLIPVWDTLGDSPQPVWDPRAAGAAQMWEEEWEEDEESEEEEESDEESEEVEEESEEDMEEGMEEEEEDAEYGWIG